MGNTETYNMQKIRGFGECNLKWNVFTKALLSRIKDLHKKYRNIIRSRGGRWLERNSIYRYNRDELTETDWKCSNQTKFQHEEVTTKLHQVPKSYLEMLSAGKGSISVLQWGDTGYINNTPKQAQLPGVAGQVFCVLFSLVCIGFIFIILSFYVFYLFVFPLRESCMCIKLGE